MKAKVLVASVLSAGAILFMPAAASAGAQLITPAVALNKTLDVNGSATPIHYRYGKFKRGGLRLHYRGFRGGYGRHRGFGTYKFSRKRFHRKPLYGYGRYSPYAHKYRFGGHRAFGRFGGN